MFVSVYCVSDGTLFIVDISVFTNILSLTGHFLSLSNKSTNSLHGAIFFGKNHFFPNNNQLGNTISNKGNAARKPPITAMANG